MKDPYVFKYYFYFINNIRQVVSDIFLLNKKDKKSTIQFTLIQNILFLWSWGRNVVDQMPVVWPKPYWLVWPNTSLPHMFARSGTCLHMLNVKNIPQLLMAHGGTCMVLSIWFLLWYFCISNYLHVDGPGF